MMWCFLDSLSPTAPANKANDKNAPQKKERKGSSIAYDRLISSTNFNVYMLKGIRSNFSSSRNTCSIMKENFVQNIGVTR